MINTQMRLPQATEAAAGLLEHWQGPQLIQRIRHIRGYKHPEGTLFVTRNRSQLTGQPELPTGDIR